MTTQDKDLKALSERLGVPLLDTIPKGFDKTVLEYVSHEAAKKYGIVPYKKEKGLLYVAMLDPENFDSLNVLRFLAEKEKLGIEVALADPDIFIELIKNYSGADAALSEAIVSLKKEEGSLSEGVKAKPAKEMAVYQDAPIAKLVEVIVQHAIDNRASDIHIEPIENNYRVRFRIDGILRADLLFPLEVGRAVISRIKILANLKIDEKRKPQDGRIRFEPEEGKESIDLRISSLPVMEGEKIVMRVLDKSTDVANLDNLGLYGRARTILEKKIHEPFGIILITGPTGSGKSTSLYAFLQILNKEERNIITLEDPVEYFLEGVNQSQIKPEIGYTFASGLRSILRQDPNVIMVGEVRDSETAELSIHAALTGHLVLSTLHTNNSVGSIPRLVDMGIEPFLLASSLQAVAAQRLVRRICEHCKQEEIITLAQKKVIEDLFQTIPKEELKAFKIKQDQKIIVYKGKGCDKCGNSGYKGRIAIYEVLDIDDEMHAIIADKRGQENEVQAQAEKQGMLTMKQDGVLKVLQGVTTLSEIERVTEGNIMIDEE